MFNKRESASENESSSLSDGQRVRAESSGRASGSSAVIGASIRVDGKLRGDEDLLIEGQVEGTVELKKNSVTIGAQGQVVADIYAHSIFVEGRMEGNLVASEKIVIRKSAQIKGSMTAPRISLEDGARFNGSIDMDPQTETLKKAFSQSQSSSPKPAAPPAGAGESHPGATGRPPAATDKRI